MAKDVLFVNPAVRNVISERKTYLLDNLIETSAEGGMQMLERSLSELVQKGKVSREVALRYCLRPGLLEKLLR